MLASWGKRNSGGAIMSRRRVPTRLIST